MGLEAITETVELFRERNISMTERDREFTVQFAFRTNDRELTEKLVDELAADGADREDICRKYQTLADFQPNWIQKIENLLISLEMYRVQEAQAVKTLSKLLSACGISVSESEIRRTDAAKVQERVKKEASL
ncbi:MAG: hypothetical protein HFH41_09265 [Lachnospiraceae bacterium]|nr:hypothetical protein [Lachnospiraceae bacterium]